MLFNSLKLNPWHYLLLAAFLFFAFYFGLASYPLSNDNEGLYAEIAREMLATGNYIIPHLNYVPYIEKPPLLYWLVALVYHFFKVSVFSTRFIPVTAATAVCLGLVWFGQKIARPFEGWLAAVILATSLGFIIIARMLFFDMLLTVCMTFSLLLFYLWYLNNKASYLRIAYAMVALGVLTKGLICLALVVLITLSFLALNKEWKRIGRLFDLYGIAIFLLIVLPWHIAASIKQPGFLNYYFVNEQLLRFLNKRQPHDYYTGPIYYYIPRILIYIFPWCFFTPLLAQRKLTILANKSAQQLVQFFWLWFLIPLLFFSISQAKANYYMVIGVPPLIYLLSIKLKENLCQKKTGIFVFAFSCFCALSLIFIVFCKFGNLQASEITKQLLLLSNRWQWLFLLYSFLGLLLSLIIYRMNQRLLKQQNKKLLGEILATTSNHYYYKILLLIIWVSGITLVLLFFSQRFVPRIQDQLSEIRLATYVNEHPIPATLYIYGDYTKISSLLFYMHKRLPIVDSGSADLLYGATTSEAKGWFLSAAEFIKQAKRKPVYVAMPKDDLIAFNIATKGLHFATMAETGEGILLSNLAFYNGEQHEHLENTRRFNYPNNTWQ